MSFVERDVLVPGTSTPIKFKGGTSSVVLGANGSGKTRFGVWLEQQLADVKVIRIPAHRALTIPDSIVMSGLKSALNKLYSGSEGVEGSNDRIAHKYAYNPATALVNDYNAVLKAFFAEQSAVAVQHLKERLKSANLPVPTTAIMRLKKYGPSYFHTGS